MDQLIQQVAQKAGISQDQAKVAVEFVVNLLKTKLPAPIAGQIDGLLSGQSPVGGDVTKEAGNILGGVLGNKK